MAVDPRYEILFEPVQVGPVTAPNRFYRSRSAWPGSSTAAGPGPAGTRSAGLGPDGADPGASEPGDA